MFTKRFCHILTPVAKFYPATFSEPYLAHIVFVMCWSEQRRSLARCDCGHRSFTLLSGDRSVPDRSGYLLIYGLVLRFGFKSYNST